MTGVSEIQASLEALPALDRKMVTVDTVKAMSDADKRDVARAMGAPTQPVTNSIWTRVVTAFVVVLVGAFAAIAVYMYLGKPVETMLTVFTTVAAFLGGLLAPSPVEGK